MLLPPSQHKKGAHVSSVLLLAQILGVSAMVVLFILTSGIKIVREHERGVIFRLGRLMVGPKGPGLILLLPFVDRMVKVDLRTVTTEVPTQEVIPATTSPPT